MINRRQFLQSSALAASAAVTGLSLSACKTFAKNTQWPIGCFNRPWVDVKAGYTYDNALDGIKEAGYNITGLLTTFKGSPFIDEDATPQYLQELKDKIAARKLICNMAALHTRTELSVPDSIKNVRAKIDKAAFLGVEFLLTFGADFEKDYENYYKVMADAAPYAQEKGIKLVLKPHGGGSGAAEEILRCIKKVNQPNFKIWYDAGNIIYYTGKDPIEQYKPIAEHVTGFCAKDCAGLKGEIWLDFGKGKVDFPAMFRVMKESGFNGPVMVECCYKGTSLAETTSGARRNREQLQKWFAEI